MKSVATLLALAGCLALPALAGQPGGISGTVVDAKTGAPIPHAMLYYYRSPYRGNGYDRIMTLQTNRRGFFSDITLRPGRYVIMARFSDRVEGCAVDDVIGSEVTRLRLEIGRDHLICTGPRVHPALVDPNATADVYLR